MTSSTTEFIHFQSFSKSEYRLAVNGRIRHLSGPMSRIGSGLECTVNGHSRTGVLIATSDPKTDMRHDQPDLSGIPVGGYFLGC